MSKKRKLGIFLDNLKNVTKATSCKFLSLESALHQTLILSWLKIESLFRVLIGHININLIRSELDFLTDTLQDNYDKLLTPEIKIYDTFLETQFFEFEKWCAIRASVGGVLVWVA